MNDWDLSNIRADIMLATDIKHLQAIDSYYENIINNLQSKIDKANEILDKLEMQPAYLDCKYYELGGFDELRNALKEDK